MVCVHDVCLRALQTSCSKSHSVLTAMGGKACLFSNNTHMCTDSKSQTGRSVSYEQNTMYEYAPKAITSTLMTHPPVIIPEKNPQTQQPIDKLSAALTIRKNLMQTKPF